MNIPTPITMAQSEKEEAIDINTVKKEIETLQKKYPRRINRMDMITKKAAAEMMAREIKKEIMYCAALIVGTVMTLGVSYVNKNYSFFVVLMCTIAAGFMLKRAKSDLGDLKAKYGIK